MTTKSRHARCAGSAIAAALALGSTPLLAQDASSAAPANTQTQTAPAQPVLVSPVSPSAQPSTTPVQIPVPTASDIPGDGAGRSASPATPSTSTTNSSTPIPTTSNPVVQDLPEEPAEASAAPVTTSEESVAQVSEPASAPSAAAAPIEAAEPAAPAASELPLAEDRADNTESAEIAPLPAVAPIPEAAPEPAIETSDGSDLIGLTGIIVSILALLGLVLLSAFAFRRRKVPVAKVERPKVAPRKALPAAKPAPVIATPVAEEAEPLERDIREWAQPVPPSREVTQLRETGEGLPHAGAAIALPKTLPASRAERLRLLDRMVAARPDRANPFRTRKARRHRAKLILQSIGRRFESGKSLIDLSQYPMNWPELARRDLPEAA